MPHTILIVEDDRAIAELIAMTLQVSDYQPVLCHDGMEAFQLLQSNAYHLAILDVMLPGLDGFMLRWSSCGKRASSCRPSSTSPPRRMCPTGCAA